MAKTITITGPTPGSVIANQAAYFTVTISSTDTTAVSLTSLVINERRNRGAQIGQPTFLAPGQPAGIAPTLSASSSLSYQFSVVANSPNTPGVSPSNPGGAAPGQAAYPPPSASLVLEAQAQTSDGSVTTSTLTVPVLSAVFPFPVPQGGAAQFGQGGDSNLIAVIL